MPPCWRRLVQDAVKAEVWSQDPKNMLHGSEFANIVKLVAGWVRARMAQSQPQRTVLEEQDHDFIRETCGRMVQNHLHPRADRRFRTGDRVVCRLAGRRAWAAGTILQLDRDDPDDPTGQTQIPYLVRIDPPNSRLICVPRDENGVVRAEACFWHHADAGLPFTLACKPVRQASWPRRFGVGGRVAVAIEDAAGASRPPWTAGTVLEVDYDAGREAKGIASSSEWPSADAVVPYRVLLDTGGQVLVHRDEHWLVRDLRLQPAGPRQRRVTRFADRHEDDARLWSPPQTQLFPRQFQERALAFLCTARRLRMQPPPGVEVSLGDVPAELLLCIVAASTGREQIDHQTCQIRVQAYQSGSDSDE